MTPTKEVEVAEAGMVNHARPGSKARRVRAANAIVEFRPRPSTVTVAAVMVAVVVKLTFIPRGMEEGIGDR